MIVARELLDHAHGAAFVADTGSLDRKLYRIRYLVEVCFHSLKRFRAIGTRYDKTKRSYLALLHVACIWLWLS
jgi:transposase